MIIDVHIGLLRPILSRSSTNALSFRPAKTEKYVAIRSRLAVDIENAYQILKMKNAGHVGDVQVGLNFVMEDVGMEDACLPHVRGRHIARMVAAHVHSLQWKLQRKIARTAAILEISRAALSNNLLLIMQLHVWTCPVHSAGSVPEQYLKILGFVHKIKSVVPWK